MDVYPLRFSDLFMERVWGGRGLERVLGKTLPPEKRIGESWEVSDQPGAMSAVRNGAYAGLTLGELRERFPEELMGPRGLAMGRGRFPLLIKFLDCEDRLSVQVHPDDAYAQRHENKLGKTEAWVILDAKPGAKLVYGIREGVDRAQLGNAAEQGRAVEDLLRYVEVKPGDVFYIPAGTVHAIGEGILLYEIQQSSDITYRFYDWERRDEHGNKRMLHTRQALDVVSLGEPPLPQPVRACPLRGEGKLDLLLDTPFFSVSRYSGCWDALLPADRRRFAMLTAIQPATLHYLDRSLALAAGQTALLPANGEDIRLTGEELLYSCPTVKETA